ncbi:CaiB/BaiF CoA-transferase family protein [Rhodococcus sp. IEGM 1366]|uniref:CaiB/BaiF CoA transferase family protein n=1 Tax=Rhodococcus sp. IEGM 1366 TaxID=3082223 RepID=UPI002953AD7F|nr:CaiB/BaiF CoA-transferase family protein [Rhodococcus sp. IEGM 1366]MDV8070910.1 CaiB/BaiF CoA-transferase family protein [Rhodococcus sp. IEGM 1366]
MSARGGAGVGALAGTKVVVLEGLGPTPFISMLLSDMGAEVVRVARPRHRSAREIGQTKGLTPDRDVVNRGTTSVEVDLKSPSGIESVLQLIESADIFIEGFRPGVVERLGLGPEVLLERNRAIVFARITGYGQSGRLARSVGHDINYVAQSGVLHTLGHPGERPRPAVNYLGDYAGGGALGAFGIVCALLEAARSGSGQVVDVSMVDGAALLTARMQGLRAAGLFSDEPGTNHVDNGAPFYDTYRCADGRFVAVGALEEDFYRPFLAGLGSDTTAWPDRNDEANWPQLRTLIEERIGTKPMAEWAEIFDGTDACVSPVLNFPEAARDPHNTERAVFVDVDGVLQPAPSPRLGRTPSRVPGQSAREGADIGDVIADWSRDTAPVDSIH